MMIKIIFVLLTFLSIVSVSRSYAGCLLDIRMKGTKDVSSVVIGGNSLSGEWQPRFRDTIRIDGPEILYRIPDEKDTDYYIYLLFQDSRNRICNSAFFYCFKGDTLTISVDLDKHYADFEISGSPLYDAHNRALKKDFEEYNNENEERYRRIKPLVGNLRSADSPEATDKKKLIEDDRTAYIRVLDRMADDKVRYIRNHPDSILSGKYFLELSVKRSGPLYDILGENVKKSKLGKSIADQYVYFLRETNPYGDTAVLNLFLGESVLVPPDTIVYKGCRYLTNADLFSYGGEYYHIPGFPVWDERMDEGLAVVEERMTHLSGRTPVSYCFECDSSGFLFIGPGSVGISPRSREKEERIWDYRYKAPRSISVVFRAVKERTDYHCTPCGNIASKEMYIFRATRYRSDVWHEDDFVNYPLQIDTVEMRQIVPGSKYDDPRAFAAFLTRSAGKELLKKGGSADVRIWIDEGRSQLLSCSNDRIAPFLSTLLDSLPVGSLTGYYETFFSNSSGSDTWVYPVLDYHIVFDSKRKKVFVEFIEDRRMLPRF